MIFCYYFETLKTHWNQRKPLKLIMVYFLFKITLDTTLHVQVYSVSQL